MELVEFLKNSSNNSVRDEMPGNQKSLHLEFLPHHYSLHYLNYQRTYFCKNGFIEIPLSILGFDEILYWPLIGERSEQDDLIYLSSDGNQLLEPVFNDDLPVNTRHRILRKIYEKLNILNMNGVICRKANFYPRTDPTLPRWVDLGVQERKQVFLESEILINLQDSEDAIYGQFNSNLKRCINQGMKHYNYHVHDHRIESTTWDKFTDLHRQVAGKVTRSPETWKIQYENCKNENGFLVTANSKQSGELVSCLYIEHNGFEAIYAVSATNRQEFKNGVTHAMHWLTIQKLKKLNLKFYKIGENPHSKIDLSEKERGILNFKRQFTNRYYPKYSLYI